MTIMRTKATDIAGLDARIEDAVASQNAQTGTAYTFALADAGRDVVITNGSAITATIPPNTDVAFPIGTRIRVVQGGAGQITIAPGSGVTIRKAAATLKVTAQYGQVELWKQAANTWFVKGELAAS